MQRLSLGLEMKLLENPFSANGWNESKNARVSQNLPVYACAYKQSRACESTNSKDPFLQPVHENDMYFTIERFTYSYYTMYLLLCVHTPDFIISVYIRLLFFFFFFSFFGHMTSNIPPPFLLPQIENLISDLSQRYFFTLGML